jgi:predicted acyl esterase
MRPGADQSTWFPVIDRNPQKFVTNIFEAKDSDYQKATQRIYRTRNHASYVSVPVMFNKGSEADKGR